MDTTQAPDVRTLLKQTAVFGHLKPAELDALLEEMAWFWLPGRSPLYLRGEPSDALYFLKSGSLGVFGVPHLGGPPRMLGVIPAGKTLGEVGLIMGEPRTHSVRALRDSELLRLPASGFETLVARHPQAMIGAARVAVHALHRDEATSEPRTFAILPFDGGVDVRGFTTQLQRQLEAWGDCLAIGARLGQGRSAHWFTAREAENRFVLYVDDGDAAWRRLCQRQADAFLLLVNAEHTPAAWPYVIGARAASDTTWPYDPQAATEPAQHRPRHLILQHPPGRFIYGAAHRWRQQVGVGKVMHHHWRRNDDIARLVRLLSGHSTGLVLSGGGARGFAQIGVIQALREAGVTIDAVVGTSVGAIIGAGIAYEWDDAKMRKAYYHAFVEGKPLSDWTVPLVALTRGARTATLLREAVGEIDIEDLPIRFACVSADLTLGTTAVHREGLLWRWLRASSAIPGILPPVFFGGHVYVDGGVINNLPTDVLAEEGHRRVIAVDIGEEDPLHAGIDEAASPPLPTLWTQRRTQHLRPTTLSILLRAGMVNSETASAQRRELANLLLRPDMGRIGMFEWQAFDRAIQIGYRYTRDTLRRTPLATLDATDTH